MGLLLSSNQSANKKSITEVGNSIETPQIDTETTKTSRETIIEELKRLQSIFNSNDMEEIAGIFTFPISLDVLNIYIDNERFDEQVEKNDNRITRSMFSHFYRDISTSLQVQQMNLLFKNLFVDDLLHDDNIEHHAIIKTAPCYTSYGIKIEDDLVTLTIGSNSNIDYKGKTISAYEVPENDSSMCESVLWWVFSFDGKQLHFKEILAAG